MSDHLWEIDHPYYGAEGYINEVPSFDELKEMIDPLDQDMSHVYRWDWKDWPNDEDGDEDSEETLYVFVAMPRKSSFFSVSCPITKEQEPEVLEWLKSPRVLGALRAMWEPLLGVER